MSLHLIGLHCHCRGCDALVDLWWDTIGNREMLINCDEYGALHLCENPSQRERVDLTPAQMMLTCERCGSRDVALSSWGRIVESPRTYLYWDNLTMIPHVCETERHAQRKAAVTTVSESLAVAGLAVPELD